METLKSVTFAAGFLCTSSWKRTYYLHPYSITSHTRKKLQIKAGLDKFYSVSLKSMKKLQDTQDCLLQSSKVDGLL